MKWNTHRREAYRQEQVQTAPAPSEPTAGRHTAPYSRCRCSSPRSRRPCNRRTAENRSPRGTSSPRSAPSRRTWASAIRRRHQQPLPSPKAHCNVQRHGRTSSVRRSSRSRCHVLRDGTASSWPWSSDGICRPSGRRNCGQSPPCGR